MKTILVTGSSGLVGTHLVHKLIEKGYYIVGVDIKRPDYEIDPTNFNYIQVDLTDSKIVETLFERVKPDGVINSFGIKGSPIRAKENPLDFLEPSIKANINIIEQSYVHHCWLVFMSSVGVYEPAEEFVEDTVWKTLPSPNDWFPSWSKRIPELYLEAYRVQHNWKDWTIVRPANIFGEYDNFGDGATVIGATCKKVYEADNEIEAWGDGTPTRDFIYAGDVADGCIKCLEDRLHITTNLGSGEEISIKRMIETLIDISGKELSIKWDTSKPNGDLRRKMSTKIQEQYGLLPKLGFTEDTLPIEHVQGDLRDPHFCEEVTKDVDVVFMAAANTSNALDTKVNPLLHVTPNVTMNVNVMEHSWRNGVRKFIFISSNTVYPDLGDQYCTEDIEVQTPNIYPVYKAVGWMKRYGETLCEFFSNQIHNPMQCIIIRPSNAFGPNDKYDFEKCHVTPANIRKVADNLNPIPLWGDGTEVRDIIHVDDMVSGFRTVAENVDTYDIYNVCYGKGHTVMEVLETIKDIEENDNPIEFVNNKAPMIPVRLLSNEKLRKLGWEPKYDIRSGLEDALRWYTENKNQFDPNSTP